VTNADSANQSQSPQGTPSVPLTNGQRRALAALLTQIARAVERYEALLGVQLSERLTYVVAHDTLTPAEQDLIYHTLTVLVREANALATLCHIPTQVREVRSLLAGEFNILWSDAEDTGPDGLVGYGPVHPQARQALSQPIRTLAWLSLCIGEIAGSGLDGLQVERLQQALGAIEVRQRAQLVSSESAVHSADQDESRDVSGKHTPDQEST
jgi:hypothetical protein